MRPCGSRVCFKSKDWCLCNKRRHTEMPTQVRPLCDNGDKDYQVSPKLSQGKEEFYPRAFRGSMALATLWMETPGLQKSEKIYFQYFRMPSLWKMVMQTNLTGNSSTQPHWRTIVGSLTPNPIRSSWLGPCIRVMNMLYNLSHSCLQKGRILT